MHVGELEECAARLELDLDPDYVSRVRALVEDGHSFAEALGIAYELVLGREHRRKGGVYYTPERIAAQVVADTLGPTVAGRKTPEITRLRIADLACGCGMFLVTAAEFLRGHCHQSDPKGVAAIGGDAALRAALLHAPIGIDVDARAADVARLALACWAGEGSGEGPVPEPAVVVASGLDHELESVDAVIGNPPWGQKGFVIDRQARANLRRRFRVAGGPLDPFKLFVERALDVVREEGRVGMVLPDIILLKNQEAVRRLLLEQTEISHLSHLGRIFPAVNLDAVVLVCTRVARPRSGHRIAIRDGLPGPEDGLRFQEQSVFSELPGAKFNLYLDDATLALYRKLRGKPRLDELFEVHEGVHSGNCREQLFVDRPPKGPHARLILGRDELTPFKLTWGGRFLDLDPSIIDRSHGHYANLGQPHWHQAGKLVVRRTGDRMVAARDTEGYYVSNNMLVVLPKVAMSEDELSAFLGVVGSGLSTWFFRTEQPRVGRLFAELKVHHLRSFPIPRRAAWTAAVRRLSSLVAEIEEGDSSAADRLDEVVFDLFDLTPAERVLVRGRIDP